MDREQLLLSRENVLSNVSKSKLVDENEVVLE